MEQQLTVHQNGSLQQLDSDIIASLVINGDLSKLNQQQRVAYYRQFCERLGLDPISQPFKLLRLNGKEILYCDRSGAQQLNKIHKVSHEIKAREVIQGCYVVTAQASTPDGRHTESIGAVNIDNLKGEALCNAMMKGETKAKRRATLDLLGLGILDETEAASIPNAEMVDKAFGPGVGGKAGGTDAHMAELDKDLPEAPEDYESGAGNADEAETMYELYLSLWANAVDKCPDKKTLKRFYDKYTDRITADANIKDIFKARQAALTPQRTPAEQEAAAVSGKLSDCKTVKQVDALAASLSPEAQALPQFIEACKQQKIKIGKDAIKEPVHA